MLPRAISALRRSHPSITVTTREGSTPALVRALRAGSLDLALLASAPPFRPPDAESPALTLETLAERNLRLAVPASHPLAAHDSVNVADLRGQRWIAGPAAGEELLMGVWPGLDERPVIAHTVRDWLAKLQLVAAGAGLTTISASMAPAAPPGVRVVTVSGGSKELRRTILARLPGRMSEPAALLADTLRTAALEVGPAG
jgi:DNA-binding transcriptional LysR family regulator